MNKKGIIVVLILVFGLALGAGVVAGKLAARLPTKELPTATRGTLSDALQLTDDQRNKMQSIWEGVRTTSGECLAQAQAAQREQDDALMKILTPEQKTQWSELSQQTAGKVAVLDARRKEAFRKAVAATEALLNDSQRKAYEKIIQDRVGELPDSSFERP